MSFAEFKEAAKESILYARFMAEFQGVSVAQITLWLNAMNAPKPETAEKE
jgi:hypothetical protein